MESQKNDEWKEIKNIGELRSKTIPKNMKTTENVKTTTERTEYVHFYVLLFSTRNCLHN
jgi:hypothetical protein